MDKQTNYVFDFNPTNPYAYEWALLLAKYNFRVIYIHQPTPFIRKKTSTLSVLEWDKLSLRDLNFRGTSIFFLPWLPARAYFFKFILFWVILRFPRIAWVDHTPNMGRTKEGLVINNFRKIKNTKLLRVTHSGVPSGIANSNNSVVNHPIFFNYSKVFGFESKHYNCKNKIIFFGRINRQKGADLLPELARILNSKLHSQNRKIDFVIIGGGDPKTLDYLKNEFEDNSFSNINLNLQTAGQLIGDFDLLNELASSVCVVAPYRDVAASSTASLAIALWKTVLFFGDRKPPGLSEYPLTKFAKSFNGNLDKFADEIILNLDSHETLEKSEIDKLEQECVQDFITLIKF